MGIRLSARHHTARGERRDGAILTDNLGCVIYGNDDGQPDGDYIATISGTRVAVGGLPLARATVQPATGCDAIIALLARGQLDHLQRAVSVPPKAGPAHAIK